MATGMTTRGEATHTPSIKSNASTPLGSTWLTSTQTSALALRWSSRSLASQPSLLVRLNSHKMLPQGVPLPLFTRFAVELVGGCESGFFGFFGHHA